jgi:hypothetical protein
MFGWWPKLVMPNFRQTMTATESVASKIEAKLVTSFDTKMNLWHLGQGARKVRHAIAIEVNQPAAEEIVAWPTFSMASFGLQPNMPLATDSPML